jgi:hypothetical protein
MLIVITRFVYEKLAKLISKKSILKNNKQLYIRQKFQINKM